MQCAARSKPGMLFNGVQYVLSPKLMPRGACADRLGDRSCILNDDLINLLRKKNPGAMVLSMTLDTQLSLSTSDIAYTINMYEPRCGTEIWRRLLNPRSPLLHISARRDHWSPIKTRARDRRTVRARPHAAALCKVTGKNNETISWRLRW